MPLYISIPFAILFLCLTILFAIFFWREQKHPKPNKYPDRSIRKFFKSSLSTLYLLIATIFGLAIIAIMMLIIV